jgi:dTDP-4-dehydrorhamnose reductase
MASHEVVGVDRSKLKAAPFPIVNADLLKDGDVERVLDQTQPQWVIHCAALANLEECESDPDLARRMNADLPSALAKACHERGLAMVQISTDAVFDGTKAGSYVESDAPNPLSVYARTKLEGERLVLDAHPGAIVARVNFYGWSLSGRRSLAEFFHHNLTNNKSMTGYTDVIFCPLHVRHLGQLLLGMLEKNLHGLYHVVGRDPMSKYRFGVEIANRFSLNPSEISPRSINTSSLIARRANNLYLSIDKLSTDLGMPIPSFSTGLDLFYQQYQEGYPQKLRSFAQ